MTPAKNTASSGKTNSRAITEWTRAGLAGCLEMWCFSLCHVTELCVSACDVRERELSELIGGIGETQGRSTNKDGPDCFISYKRVGLAVSRG